MREKITILYIKLKNFTINTNIYNNKFIETINVINKINSIKFYTII